MSQAGGTSRVVFDGGPGFLEQQPGDIYIDSMHPWKQVQNFIIKSPMSSLLLSYY